MSKDSDYRARTFKEAYESLTQEDWAEIAENASCAQLMTLANSYKKIIGRYQHLCGELYQVLGALDAPAHVLDRVSDASDSMVVCNTPSLLPFDPHAWPKTDEPRLLSYATDMVTCTLVDTDGGNYFFVLESSTKTKELNQ